MSIKSCTVCEVQYENPRSNSKYCSQTCKDKGKPSASGLSCFICGQRMYKSSTSKPQGEAAHGACRSANPQRSRACEDCGSSNEWFKGRRCSPCRYKRAMEKSAARGAYCHCGKASIALNLCSNHYSKLRRDKVGRVTSAEQKKRDAERFKARYIEASYDLSCEVCQSAFQAKDRRARICSNACRRFLYTGWSASKELAIRTKVRQTVWFGKAIAPRRGSPLVAGPCLWCSALFVGYNHEVYCSKKCSISASYKSRAGFHISPRIRLDIYGRDNNTCQLCFEEVDMALPSHHKWAATLDHIEPQSLAVVPDHSPSNLRLAHRYCNSKRGNRVEPELLAA